MKSYKDKVAILKQEINAIENELRENVYKVIIKTLFHNFFQRLMQ